MCVHLFFVFFTSRPHLWRISATYPPNRGGRGCSRGSMSSAKSSRKRWIRGKASKQIPCAITNHHHSSRKIKEIIIIDQSVLTCPILINVDVFLFVTFLWPVNCLVSPVVHVKSCLCLSETPWTRWRMCMRRIHRWETPAACSPKYQRRYVTWRSCAQKSTKMRYEFVELYRFIQLLDLSLCGSCRCQKTPLSLCLYLSLGWQTWLSEVEGKQSSRGDRRHSADNHHHTPQGRERYLVTHS